MQIPQISSETRHALNTRGVELLGVSLAVPAAPRTRRLPLAAIAAAAAVGWMLLLLSWVN